MMVAKSAAMSLERLKLPVRSLDSDTVGDTVWDCGSPACFLSIETLEHALRLTTMAGIMSRITAISFCMCLLNDHYARYEYEPILRFRLMNRSQ